jgi:hypothetical protein
MRTLLRSVLASALVLVLGWAAVSRPARSQAADAVQAAYTKQEVSIPMRDGVKLFTQVYVPKDRSRTYPIIMNRTPYGIAPYGADVFRASLGPSALFTTDGDIFVYQDVRGRWMSEGVFDDMRPHLDVKHGPADIDESTDTYDTIEWLLKNVPGHNGRVGQFGISYPGFYTSAGMIEAHPALKASSPQAPIADWFSQDDWHHNGALLIAHAFNWFKGNGWPFAKPSAVRIGTPIDLGTQDGYRFYLDLGPVANANNRYFHHGMPGWESLMTHGTKDAFWQARNLRPHMRNITPAVMTVGGWYDAENLFGAVETYRTVEAQSPGTSNILVMGPWVHGGWSRGTGASLGDVNFGSNTAEFFRQNIELTFFNAYLKGNGAADLPEAYVFETGANQWHKFDAWPPKTATSASLYLLPNGRLSFDPPPATAATFDEYVSDPAHPVPLISGMAPGMAQRYMIDDQRFAARRADVVAYQTEPLAQDTTLVGLVSPSLRVSTTGTDADFIVKLIDVYPAVATGQPADLTLDNYQQLVRGDVMRGKFRNSLAKPEPFVPGQTTTVAFTESDIYHTFKRGHRIMVQVQSTWFPLFDLNPGKFMDIYAATAADFRKTTQRVYHSATLPSLVKVQVLKGGL